MRNAASIYTEAYGEYVVYRETTLSILLYQNGRSVAGRARYPCKRPAAFVILLVRDRDVGLGNQIHTLRERYIHSHWHSLFCIA